MRAALLGAVTLVACGWAGALSVAVEHYPFQMDSFTPVQDGDAPLGPGNLDAIPEAYAAGIRALLERPEARPWAARLLVLMGPEVVPEVFTLLRSDNGLVRSAAESGMRALDLQEWTRDSISPHANEPWMLAYKRTLLPVYGQAILHDDATVRAVCVLHITRWGLDVTEVAPWVAEALDDPHHLVRLSAMFAFGAGDDDPDVHHPDFLKCIGLIARLLADENEEVRKHALWKLEAQRDALRPAAEELRAIIDASAAELGEAWAREARATLGVIPPEEIDQMIADVPSLEGSLAALFDANLTPEQAVALGEQLVRGPVPDAKRLTDFLKARPEFAEPLRPLFCANITPMMVADPHSFNELFEKIDMPCPEQMEALLIAMKDKWPYTGVAVNALAELGEGAAPHYPRLIEWVIEGDKLACEGVEALAKVAADDDASFEACLAFLVTGEHCNFVDNALAQFLKAKPERLAAVEQELRKLYKKKKPKDWQEADVQKDAVNYLTHGVVKSGLSPAVVLEGVSAKRDDLRQAAINSFWNIEPPATEVIAALQARLNSKKEDDCEGALHVLKHLAEKNPAATAAMQQAVDSGKCTCRDAVLEALGNAGGEEVLARLEREFKQPMVPNIHPAPGLLVNWASQSWEESELSDFGRDVAEQGEAAARVMAQLLERLEHAEDKERNPTEEEMVAMPPSSQRADLLFCLGEMGKAALPAREVLIRLMAHPHHMQSAAKVLSRAGVPFDEWDDPIWVALAKTGTNEQWDAVLTLEYSVEDLTPAFPKMREILRLNEAASGDLKAIVISNQKSDYTAQFEVLSFLHKVQGDTAEVEAVLINNIRHGDPHVVDRAAMSLREILMRKWLAERMPENSTP